MEVIGADGVHIGTVDRLEGKRIKLTRKDSGGAGFGGGHEHHHHFIPMALVATIEGQQVRLSANADVAVTMEEEEAGEAIDADKDSERDSHSDADKDSDRDSERDSGRDAGNTENANSRNLAG